MRGNLSTCSHDGRRGVEGSVLGGGGGGGCGRSGRWNVVFLHVNFHLLFGGTPFHPERLFDLH